MLMVTYFSPLYTILITEIEILTMISETTPQ
jgi:hypothetical protein